MKNILPVTKAVTKVAEVIHWAGAALMLALSVCSVAAPGWIQKLLNTGVLQIGGNELNVYGFELTIPMVGNTADLRGLLLFGICGVIVSCLVAMIFRNLNLIVKKAENSTPFQPDTVRMVREIGIFAIAIPVVGLIMSVICGLVLGSAGLPAEITVRMEGVIWGIVVLCLTQFFVHGAKLEEDVDGLV